MKKSILIIMLIIEIALFFVFQNIHFLFKEIERGDVEQISDQAQFLSDLKKIRQLFSGLSISLGVLIGITGISLVVLYRRSRSQTEHDKLPPLHDYLLELKGSETQLKNLLEQQKGHVIEKDELNKSIINNINVAIIFINQTGRITGFNPVAESVFSQSYINARNNFPGKIFQRFPEIMQFVEENPSKKVSREIVSGEKVFSVDWIPIENVGRLFLLKDITDEKKREEIDRRNQNFVMLGEMAAFLAHEVRNSLGVIYGYTKTIQSEKEKTDKVNKEIQFLSSMMETFLNFSKPVKPNRLEEFDLGELLKNLAIENRIELTLPEEKMIIENDAASIQSIFSNLFHNSSEAGAGHIEISCTIKEDRVTEILFKDNGKGIDENIREKIFYPFFTTKEKGTGMGLAIIRKVINSLNGEISLVESSPQGTLFKIVFYR